MGEWTFRVFGEPVELTLVEQRDVRCEISRLRTLIRGAPENGRVRVSQNPAGLVGEYASLLIEATVRRRPAGEIVPDDVRQRYGDCDWFTTSQEVLIAFCQEWLAVRAEGGTREHARSIEQQD